MSILEQHFERVREMEAKGIPIIRGVFSDAGRTLIDPYEFEDSGGINLNLWRFLKWCHDTGTAPITILSGDPEGMQAEFNKLGINLNEIDAAGIRKKSDTFHDAYVRQKQDNNAIYEGLERKSDFKARASYVLELVIDDMFPWDANGILDTGKLALTHWDPMDPEVRAFLASEEYKTLSR